MSRRGNDVRYAFRSGHRDEPVAGAGLAAAVSFSAVFAAALGAALLQVVVLWRLRPPAEGAP